MKLKQSLTCSFIIVTHDQELANQMDRRLVLLDGQLVNQEGA